MSITKQNNRWNKDLIFGLPSKNLFSYLYIRRCGSGLIIYAANAQHQAVKWERAVNIQTALTWCNQIFRNRNIYICRVFCRVHFRGTVGWYNLFRFLLISLLWHIFYSWNIKHASCQAAVCLYFIPSFGIKEMLSVTSYHKVMLKILRVYWPKFSLDICVWKPVSWKGANSFVKNSYRRKFNTIESNFMLHLFEMNNYFNYREQHY
jgi:hypothetical protein